MPLHTLRNQMARRAFEHDLSKLKELADARVEAAAASPDARGNAVYRATDRAALLPRGIGVEEMAG